MLLCVVIADCATPPISVAGSPTSTMGYLLAIILDFQCRASSGGHCWTGSGVRLEFSIQMDNLFFGSLRGHLGEQRVVVQDRPVGSKEGHGEAWVLVNDRMKMTCVNHSNE